MRRIIARAQFVLSVILDPSTYRDYDAWTDDGLGLEDRFMLPTFSMDTFWSDWKDRIDTSMSASTEEEN